MSISNGRKFEIILLFFGVSLVSLSYKFPHEKYSFPDNLNSDKAKELISETSGKDALRDFNYKNNMSGKYLKINWPHLPGSAIEECMEDLFEVKFKSYIYLENCISSLTENISKES